MFEAFLANTSTEGLTPLGTPPQRSFELINGTVGDLLGPRHAAMFAEPVATQYGDRFDWYATIDGKPLQLEQLDEDQRVIAQSALTQLISEIQEKADGLIQGKNPDDQRMGEALANALRYPGPNSVYYLFQGDTVQPVLVNWAWIEDGRTNVLGSLSGAGGKTRAAKAASIAKAQSTAAASATTAATMALGPEDRRPFSLWWLMWLGWLILAMMIATILYLMIEACALRLPFVPGYCPPPGPSVSEIERDAMVLRDQIAAIERDIGIADRACQPKREAALNLPDPDQTRLAQRGGVEGALTITLLWDSIADLHLDVKCPSGAVINFDNKNACKGQLDVGGNHSRNTAKRDALESMFFTDPDRGEYSIAVTVYDPHGQSPTQPFRLRIKDGDRVEMKTGTVVKGQGIWTTIYDVGEN